MRLLPGVGRKRIFRVFRARGTREHTPSKINFSYGLHWRRKRRSDHCPAVYCVFSRMMTAVRRSVERSVRATHVSVRRRLLRTTSPTARPSTTLPVDRPTTYQPGTFTLDTVLCWQLSL